VNYSEFETIQKIKKSAAGIRKQEKELAKRGKSFTEKPTANPKAWSRQEYGSPNRSSFGGSRYLDASDNCGNEGEA
jgi:hypothetical protein